MILYRCFSHLLGYLACNHANKILGRKRLPGRSFMFFKVRKPRNVRVALILALLGEVFTPALTQSVFAAKLASEDSQRHHVYSTNATISPGETLRVSVDSAGAQADRPSYATGSSISADERYITFSSDATNLV